MFVDTVGGVPVAGVYCTLCGTVILFHTRHEGVLHRLGTSGFLYRSNKLMYDQATQSLWSTMQGTPVVGPLAGNDIVLERGSVVTTTWASGGDGTPKPGCSRSIRDTSATTPKGLPTATTSRLTS